LAISASFIGGLTMALPYIYTRTTLTGRVPKFVACEQCAFEYVYLLEKTAVGEDVTNVLFLAGADKRASADAEARLRQALEASCEVVPCPACGHVQEHMVQRARKLRHRWMVPAAVFILVAAGFMLGSSAITMLVAVLTDRLFGMPSLLGGAGAVAAMIGIALLRLKRLWANRHNPNDEPVATRKQQGNELAVSRQEFLQMTEDEAR
jgi:hypothetical protein